MSNKNNSKLIKRLITGAMCLTLVFSINGFASVVSDNDGSAFITKAEFDSLKNNFQSQIDQYNTSIDSKIDGAIAAYLAGLSIQTQYVETNFLKLIRQNGDVIFKNFTPNEQNVTSEYDLKLYLQLWSSYTTNAQKDAYYQQFKNDGAGTIWTYKMFQGNPYIFGFYGTAYPKLISGGTVFWDKSAGKTYAYADPIGLNQVKIEGNANGSFIYKSFNNCFQTNVWTCVYDDFTDYQSNIFPGEVTVNEDFGYVLEDTKMSADLTADGVYADVTKTAGFKWSINGGFSDEPPASTNIRKLKFTTTNYNLTDFISYPATIGYGEPVRLYEGLPIFKASQTGSVKFKIKSTKENTQLYIKATRFGNANLSVESDIIINKTIGTSDTEITFDCEQGTTYWLKTSTNDCKFIIDDNIIVTKS